MNILFVCHGNICRSVMAEMILKHILKVNNISNVTVDSCATSSEEIGNSIYPPAEAKLREKGIEVSVHFARKLTVSDYDDANLIIGMDNMNIRNILNIIGNDTQGKVHMLGEYMNEFKEVDDPWYTRDFETAYNDIMDGCKGLFKEVIK